MPVHLCSLARLLKRPKTVSNAACYARFQTSEALEKRIIHVCPFHPSQKNTSNPTYIIIELKTPKSPNTHTTLNGTQTYILFLLSSVNKEFFAWNFAGWDGNILVGSGCLLLHDSRATSQTMITRGSRGVAILFLFLGFRLVAYRRTERREASSQILLRGDEDERERT